MKDALVASYPPEFGTMMFLSANLPPAVFAQLKGQFLPMRINGLGGSRQATYQIDDLAFEWMSAKEMSIFSG